MELSEIFESIYSAIEIYPHLRHASYLEKLYRTNFFKNKEYSIILMLKYKEYLETMLYTNSNEKELIRQGTDKLNSYYNYVHSLMEDKSISTKNIYRATLLGEFISLLFKDSIVSIDGEKDTEPYSHSSIVSFDDKTKPHYLPNIEIRTCVNLNERVLDGIIATAEKIKSGNPYTRFVAVTERYDVKLSVDPSYSRIDQIYVLRKAMRKQEWHDIDKDVVWKLFSDTKAHLERPWSDIEVKIKNDGLII